MGLTTLEAVKALLLIPPSNTDRDAALQLLLDGVEAHVLALTGYSLEPVTDHVDIFENTQAGFPQYTSLRPVVGTPTYEGRGRGETTFASLQGDLPNVDLGRFQILGGQDGFPPGEGTFMRSSASHTPAKFWRWRNYTWPVVRVTYDVAALTDIPKDLSSAVTELVAIMGANQIGTGGNLKSVDALGVGETYMDPKDWPRGIQGKLARYIRPNRLVRVVR